MISPTVEQALSQVAEEVGTNKESLVKLIEFESGFNPRAKNPDSSARGLIQFLDKTAEGLGYKDSLSLVNANPTIEQQLLGPVKDYLITRGPFETEQSLFMAVFYPAAKYWDAEQEFPQWVQDANPGIKTPSDYMDKVNKNIGFKMVNLPVGIITGAGLILFAGAMFSLFRKK